MTRLRGTAIAAAMLTVVFAAGAADRGHGPHEHGVGRLDVAIEGDTIEVELVMPGADAVGFEHRAESAADKAAVEAALAVLRAGATLFVFPEAARCQLEEAEVETGQLAAGEGGDAETHAEFHAHYRFHCDAPDELVRMDVRVFKRFPAARELEAQAIGPRGQRGAELTPEAARLEF